ncbi:MAG: Nramp family divalent metal transporter [Sphingorhabdus sp.]
MGSEAKGQAEWGLVAPIHPMAKRRNAVMPGAMALIEKLRFYRPGPGMLVSAAFIGPGTVTACTLAGAKFGYSLLWALLFATFATIILQGLASRVALATGKGLAEAIMAELPKGLARIAAAVILLVALLLGNAAYEAGNISGGALGIAAITGSGDAGIWPVLLGMVTILLLGVGKLRWLEKLLIGLVMLMSLSFLAALAMTRPDMTAMLSGFVPGIPDGATLTAMALIGTTIVPYNLFLHAGTTRRYWRRDQIEEAALESGISIGLGGLVSMAIVATAATAFFGTSGTIENALDMAAQIEPVYGEYARIALGLGLLGAGLTSAMTAPLATGYIVSELLNNSNANIRDRQMRWTAIAIAIVGTITASIGYRPIDVIFLAQIANGLLLPFVAFFLLWLAGRPGAMHGYAASKMQLLLGWLVALICLGLGGRILALAFGWL